MKAIKLKAIFPDIDPYDYKIHFARRASDGVEPLDEYMADTRNLEFWKEWNTYSTGKNHFNRRYIFSLIYDYHEEDTWLFGGVWEVVDTNNRSKTHPYVIKAVSRFTPFIGRLKIKYSYKNRATRVRMENHFDDMVVKEILENTYIEHFPGYNNVDLPFDTLRTIMKDSNRGNKEWKDALSIKGIYLITDTRTGKKYVGKADSTLGIWQRWKHYIRNGHGGDVALKKLIETKGMSYAEKYYRFTLLEPITGDEERYINERESYWKRVLMTRDERFGNNKN